jgi:hypothetical protein
MKHASGVRKYVQVVLCVAASGAAATPWPVGASIRQDRDPGAKPAEVTEFERRLQSYVHLREELARTLQPLSTTPSAVELEARQTSLAAALRAARKGARAGDLVPSDAAALIRVAVLQDLEHRSLAAPRGTRAEVPATAPAINGTIPADEALPTVPALLLAKLPHLPDNLQYRFLGRHVAVIDGDTELIIDYVANVLPTR